MPPIRTKKNRKNLIEQEGLKENAIRDLKSSKIESEREAAEIYDLPRLSLQDQRSGALPLEELNAKKWKLTPSEEETIIKRILFLALRGFLPRPEAIADWANLLLANQGSDLPIKHISKNWKTNFVNRYPELKSCYSQKYYWQQALCKDPKILRPWFKYMHSAIIKYGIDSSNIYNFDKTGFTIGRIAKAKV